MVGGERTGVKLMPSDSEITVFTSTHHHITLIRRTSGLRNRHQLAKSPGGRSQAVRFRSDTSAFELTGGLSIVF